MIHEEYNSEHCGGCHLECGSCDDAFKIPGGWKNGHDGFLACWVSDPDGFTIMRYAQRNAINALTKFARAKTLNVLSELVESQP